MLECLLSELNTDLQPAEKVLMSRHELASTMPFPLVLVIGPLRSGTTLFMQWLANTGLVAYPTNLLSRFYQAPILGAKIQLLLTDPRYNFRNELGEFAQHSEYSSLNGKTTGVLAPNEFWYFWRRFLADPGRDVWADEELLETMDIQALRTELVGVMDVFQKPFAAKGMLFNYNIPFLDSILDKALFIQIKRDTVTNVASVLEARKRQLGSENAWYSFRIPEYAALKDLDPINQAAGQITAINKAVTQGLSTVASKRKLFVEYEDFCASPERFFRMITEKLDLHKSETPYTGPSNFHVTRTSDISNKLAIERAIAAFAQHQP